MPYLLRRVKVLIILSAISIWLATRLDASGHFAESLIYLSLTASHAKMVQCASRDSPATADTVQCHIVALAAYGVMAVLKGLLALTGN